MERTLFLQLLNYMILNKCSDLHIIVNMKPYVRKHGDIVPIDDHGVITKEMVETVFINEIMTGQEFKMKELDKNGQVDMSFETPEGRRFRVNIFTQRGNRGIVIRKIESKVPSLFDLGLPDAVETFTKLHSGLVLVTGPTGSGKSTTLAAMIDLINSTQKKHILTIEDPIEYVHPNKLSIVNQREVGHDVFSFSDAVKASLREDPDIVLVGEMRDLDTIQNAIRVAETGHLVFATLHTISAPKTIDRIIDVFEPNAQQQIRTQLSTVLQGVVSQRLIPKIGGGVVAAIELMIVTDAMRGIIRDGKNISGLSDAITMNKQKLGTQTIDQALASLYIQKKITLDTAYSHCSDVEAMKKLIIMGR
ncbi:type IV pilus twitching motility protein PilT [Alkaliphilus sp. B6464]|uniref:type IV pilus twitching motility protein PilT n=1 Tax=Alkaliphilus sp. B6464 TaxID=2731219 RepID=UPI001BADB028|nr:PilT/PilU family type 4a pilus ATPase [Alkaliphilus sp. B6464]QUH22130.1 PilT/PilU family type 4a pilus ATPase [Alkaliphilus sp. B6464]